MTPAAPLWTRSLLRVGDAAATTLRATALVRDEILLAYTPPDARAAVTAWIYDRQRSYTTARGLRDWERAVVDTLPLRARILVGGAGAGREVAALLESGFDVVGFEPAPVLVRAASTQRGIALIGASYADVVSAARTRDGPLADTFAHGRFDLVVLGWGSLAHVTLERERTELFESLRTLAPATPVLASFFTRGARPPEGRAERLRARLRRGFARLGAPGTASPGLGFLPWAGFVHAFTWDEIDALAARTGYEVTQRADEPYPHAVFVPMR